MVTLDWWQAVMWGSWILLGFKAFLGLKWPWEICSCCKRKMRDH